MNILIVTPHFHPENFRINDLAIEFQNRGHAITVLTAIPDYPGGKFYKGYGVFKKNKEIYKGIKIYRTPIIPRGSGTNLELSLNYLSFVFGGILTSLFLLKYEFDIIFVFEPSPITVGLPAIFIKKIKKIPICFWVLDLWPESVTAAGNIKFKPIINILDAIVKFIYKHCDKILVSSNGFIKSIVSKGIVQKKIEFFPQWAEPLFKPVEIKLELLPKTIPEKSFKIMFAGNIGEAQDFPSILNAARLLKNEKNIQWIILGDGRRVEWVKNKITEYGLHNCFHMIGSHPLEKMPYFYALADALLFSLKNHNIFSITIPAKVQTYLACAKPVLAMVDGEAANVINEANAGLTCPSERPELLANNIKELSSLGQNELNKFGQNAVNYYNKEFERTMLMDRMESIFNKMTNK